MKLSPLRTRLLVGTLVAVAFLGALDHTVVATSLATIAAELDALAHMSWVVVAYTLASTTLMPVIGRLGDTIGPRTVFLVSIAVFLAASVACGFAQDMSSLIIARIVQGIGSSGIQLTSQTLVAHIAAPRDRAGYMSIVGAAFPVAIVVGPLVGGIITDTIGWPWVFWINLPLGGAAFLFALFALPRIPRSTARGPMDVVGAVTFAVGMIALVLSVTWFGEGGGVHAVIAAVIAVAGFCAFVTAEFRAPMPLLAPRLFANRRMAVATALSGIVGIGLLSVTSYLPTYVQMVYRVSATVSGFVPIATVFGMLVAGLVTGWLVARTGSYRGVAIAGPVISAVGLIAMSLLPVGVPLWLPTALMAIVGIGTGAFMNLVVAVAQSSVPIENVGAATAGVNLVRQIGGTVTTAVIGGVLGAGVTARLDAASATLTPQQVHAAAESVQSAVADAYAGIMHPVFAALAVVYALGFVLALLLPRGRIENDAPGSAPTGAPAQRTPSEERS